MSTAAEGYKGGVSPRFIPPWVDGSRQVGTGGGGTRGGRKLRRCLKVSEDQARQTEAASEASFHAKERQMKRQGREEEEGGGRMRRLAKDSKELDAQRQPGRVGGRLEGDSTVRGTCSRREHLLPPP